MPCLGCIQRREAMKAYIDKKLAAAARWVSVRAGRNPDATEQAKAPNPEAQDDEPAVTAEQPAASGQAEDAGAEYQQRSVEGDTAASPVEGRVQVPSVRKAGSRKGSAR